MRRKDVVLMATVTSFEGLSHPSKSELRQFAELFAPLFSGSSEEARRQAVAALSQSPNVPASVAFFIGSQPIAIAAPFLMASTCLSDDALITIARSQGADHARAIVRRDVLSPTVIDALVGLRPDRARGAKPATDQAAAAAAPPDITAADSERMAREENLRRRIKLLAGHVERAPEDRLGLRSVSPVQQALLVRFARTREANFFACVLADILTASQWLAERIMLDLSGQQMATVLKSLALDAEDACYILTRLYGHLAETVDGTTRAEHLWMALDEDECGPRVEAWRKADRYTHPHTEPLPRTDIGKASEASDHPPAVLERPLRTSATVRRSVAGARGR
jgi:uncharacterized protein (DUF2336 family)